jgi:hypothetical protein
MQDSLNTFRLSCWRSCQSYKKRVVLMNGELFLRNFSEQPH